jgi:hypothetical protein
MCGLPNNATDVSIIFADKQINEPLTVPVGSTAGQIINYPETQAIADLVKGFPGIGSTNTVENFADITLVSAQYDSQNKLWKIKLQIKNQYGYDLSFDRFVFFSTLSDTIMSGQPEWDESNNPEPIDIPPQ